MYHEHVALISRGMRRDLDTFKRGILFVVLSIRQPITKVPEQLRDVCRDPDSVWLFGHKRAAYDYLDKHAPALWEACKAAQRPYDAIMTLLAVPGLGIVKAAFAAQMMGFDCACLDSRNVTRLGLSPRRYRTDGRPPDKLTGKVRAYLAETEGRAAEFWNDWCEDVAEAYGLDAHGVSALHLACLPVQDRRMPDVPF